MNYPDTHQPSYYPEVPAAGRELKEPEVNKISSQIMTTISELQARLSPVLINDKLGDKTLGEPRQTSSPIIEQLLEIKSRLDILLRDIRI